MSYVLHYSTEQCKNVFKHLIFFLYICFQGDRFFWSWAIVLQAFRRSFKVTHFHSSPWKGWAMPNDTRRGVKISGNRSYGGMNPPQGPDLNIIEAVWDHLDRKRNKRQPTSKEELWDVLQDAWRTIPEDYLKKWQKACLRGFRLCWRINVLIKKILTFKLIEVVS